MTHVRSLLAAAALVVAAGCGGPSVDLDAERASLMEVSREWARAAAGGDLERIVSFWADDAIVLPPDQPAIVGKEAIREFVRSTQAIPGFSITWEPERAFVSEGGDLGYIVERNRTAMADETGSTRAQNGKVVTVWRKDASGAWKCVIDMWNNNPQEAVLSGLLRGLEVARR